MSFVSVTSLFFRKQVVGLLFNPLSRRARGFLLGSPSLRWLYSHINELHLPGFEVRVYRLLDRLPAKANDFCLAEFGIRVVFLLDGLPSLRLTIPILPGLESEFSLSYAVSVRGTLFRIIQVHPPPRRRAPLSATRGTRPYAVQPQREDVPSKL